MNARDDRPVLGAILAGGANRRYGGEPKALETVGGVRIIDRAIVAMTGATDRVVMIANDPDTFRGLELPMRPDVRPGLGALGGLLTAVAWAEDEGYRGVVVAACDMPFIAAGLLRRLRAGAGPDEIVAPESASKRGLEPLCAYYGVECRPAIERALDRGDRHIVSFFDDMRVRTLPRAELAEFGDPDLMFLNVNTPEDRDRAEAAARRERSAR